MAEVLIREAGEHDLKSVQALLEQSGLPTEGVSAHFDQLLVAEDSGEIEGAIGLERYGPYALLRSAVVAPDRRDCGIGAELITRLIDRVSANGVEALYLLTTTAEEYFPRFGFEPSTRDAVPAAVKQSAEFRGACPDTAAVMVRRITSTGSVPSSDGTQIPPARKP